MTNNCEQTIKVKGLILKYGNILLGRGENCPAADSSLDSRLNCKWHLIDISIEPHVNLRQAIIRGIVLESGWAIKNVRFFRINVYPAETNADSQQIEAIFIMDAYKKIPDFEEGVKELRWFPLTSLPDSTDILSEDLESIEALIDLVHTGKTFDFESLPPVLSASKNKNTTAADLFALSLR